LFCNTLNHLISKSFNPNISCTFSENIIIAETDLIKYIIKNSKIIKTSSMIKEIICISYHRRFSSSITSYEVKTVAYCFHNMQILTKYTDLHIIITANKKPYNLTIVNVYTAVDFDTETCQLIMTIYTSKPVRSWNYVIVTTFFLHSRRSRSNVVVVKYSKCCKNIIFTRMISIFADKMCDKLSTAVLLYMTFC